MSTASHPLASNPLWGQLLRKNTLAAPPTVPLPPTAPLDKTGTSMRILLHDTQANFERFSTKVDTLTTGIDEAKREIIIVKTLFEGAQESLTLDIVDLVNRSQTQIQKTVGEPAQATALELFRKDVNARLDGLSKRIDVMQSFNQAQSQALQNVAQTLQSLQDQQGKILSALLPLLPLLQAVPVHINSARSSISEMMLNVSLESAIQSHRTPPQTWPQPPQVIRKRSFPAGPLSSPLLARKRPRLDDEHFESDPAHRWSGDYLNGPSSPKPASRRPSFPNQGPYFSLSGPGCPSGPRPAQSHSTPCLPKPAVPRRPLGDLPVPPHNFNAESRDITYPASPKDPSSPTANLDQAPPSRSRPIPQSGSGMPRSPPPLDIPFIKGRASPPSTPSRPTAPPVPAPAAVSSSPLTAPSNHLPNHPALPNVPPAAKRTDTESTPKSSSLDPSIPPRPLGVQIVPNAVAVAVAVQQQQSAPAPVPAKFTMVRGRRSPFRDGRRFIPLDDNDSDSDDD